MHTKYNSADFLKKHWPTHKKECKRRAAELRDEALFKDPPAKEDCPICFLPMPAELISCITLPPATISYVPICDHAIANVKLSVWATKQYYSCCGKSVCLGCIHSFFKSGNMWKCPFCKAEKIGKTDGEIIERMMKRVDVNDAEAMTVLANDIYSRKHGIQQDRAKTMELWKQAAELGSSQAHHYLGVYFDEGGDSKKAKFHYEVVAMAGHEAARNKLGFIEGKLGNRKKSLKHFKIAASAGNYKAMQILRSSFEAGFVS